MTHVCGDSAAAGTVRLLYRSGMDVKVGLALIGSEGHRVREGSR